MHPREVAAWAEAHYGLISRTKLLALGASPDQIDRLARRWLSPAGRGVYFVGHRSDVPGQREALALAWAGRGAALAGPSAMAWIGAIEPWPGPIHIHVPRNRNHVRGDNVVRHTDRLEPEEVVRFNDLACATPERAVMDVPPAHLRRALQWLMQHDRPLRPIVERMHKRRGARAFRAEVERLVPELAHTMSELETRFVLLCRKDGLPPPVVNRVRSGRDLLDCVWEDAGLVVELDGRRWHQHRDREDRARDRRRTLEGLRTLRYDWWDVTRDPSATAVEVRAALGSISRECI